MKTKISFVCVVVLCALMAGCVNHNVNALDILPEAAKSTFMNFLSAFEKDGKETVEYMYFKEEYPIDKEAWLAKDHYLTDYKIEQCEKVNDDLYVVSITVTTSLLPKETVYWYIGYIDGSYYVIYNQAHIPEDISDGFDSDKYRYEDEVLPSEVV